MSTPIKLGPFLGVNNRLRPNELQVKNVGAYLESGVNVDVNPAGRLVRRGGYTLATSLNAAHSLWSDGVNKYYCASGMLYRDGVSIASVAGRCSYDVYPGGGVVFSDTAEVNYVSAAGAVSLLAPGTPSAPTLAATSGSLQPATYLVAISAVDSAGVEGGACAFQAQTLATTGGITVTLPSMPAGGATFNVYVTGPNGEIPTLHGSTVSATYTISSYAADQTLAVTSLAQMPAGDIVRIQNGRLLVASGNALYISEAYNFGLYDRSLGYILFPADIAVMEPTQNGTYVAADKTYWIAGADPRAVEAFVEVLPYGGIAGTGTRNPTKQIVAWMSPKGVVVADEQGQVKNLQEEALALNVPGTRGATLVDSDGSRILVVTNG